MAHTDDPTLAAYHDGELSPAEQLRVRGHLATCGPCSARLAALQSVDRQVAQLADPAPRPAWAAALAARVELPVARRRPRWAALLAAAASLAAIWLLAPRAPVAIPAPATARRRLARALPAFSPTGLDDALASHRGLLPARRRAWVSRLRLGRSQRAELLARVLTDDAAARALAVDWWTARPDRLPSAALAAAVVDQPAALTCAVALAARAPRAVRVRQLSRLALIARDPEPALAALLARDVRRGTETLLALLARPGQAERARRWLDRIGGPALRAVAGRLRSGAAGRPLLEYLARSEQPAALDLLANATRSRALRGDAIAALAGRRDSRAGRLLAGWASDPLAGAAAREALGRGRHVAALAAIVRRGPRGAAQHALELLAELSGADAADALACGLRRDGLERSTIDLLARQGDARGMVWLGRLARRPAWRAAVLSALVDYPSTAGHARLARLCRSPAAAEQLLPALASLDDARGLPALSAVLAHPQLAERAVRAIAQVDDARAVAALIEALDHRAVRADAHRALVARTGQRIKADADAWRRWLAGSGPSGPQPMWRG